MENVMKTLAALIAFLVCLSIGVFIISCDDTNDPDVKVVACFSVPADVRTGMPVRFDGACSENAQSFVWDFGDGSTSTEAAPLHLFLAEGTYAVTLTVRGRNNQTHVKIQDVVVSGLPVVSHILGTSQDEVWREDAIHIVYGEFDIENAIVTIMPGAVVEFDSWTSSLRVAKNATLKAVGTAEKPILFTANSNMAIKGHWEGFRFEDGASNNSVLKYCQFEYGGNDADAGMLYISGCEVVVEDSKFTKSSGYGIHVERDGKFKSFNNNVISDCDREVMFMEPDNVHTIGLNNSFNTDRGIRIGNTPLTERDVTWKKQTCPYVTDGFEVGSAAGSMLTITRGATIRLEGAPIVVGGVSGYGKLLAEGTVDEPIIFSSETETSAAPRIQFQSGTLPGTKLSHCHFDRGGTASSLYDAMGMIDLQDTHISVENTVVKNARCAFTLNPGSYFDSFEYNAIESSVEYGVVANVNWIHTIGSGNQFDGPNGIIVTGGSTYPLVHGAVTWLRQSSPYIIRDDVYIGSAEGSVLTIEPGSTMAFVGSSLYVGHNSAKGGLVADGAADSIKFTSAHADKKKGDWKSIWFAEGTLPGSVVNRCILEYSGGHAYGAIHASHTDVPVISNNTIRHTSQYGVSGQSASLTVSGNVYIDVDKEHEHFIE